MLQILNTRILLSGATILAAAALIVGATFAFFSDTESSTGNTLAAGSIDLLIDNSSYALDHNITDFPSPVGALVFSPGTSWEASDLTDQVFFNFTDLKPGDYGEDTISIRVNDNDAWACANVQVTANNENTLTEPEVDLDDTDDVGELGNELNFAFWADDGDNVFEQGEQILVEGPASNVLNGGTLALAQPAAAGTAVFGNDPLEGATTYFIGKYYCYGDFTAVGATEGDGTPADRQETGFTCDGSQVNNLSQTDSLVGDIHFYAEQSRNNPDFSCEDVVFPTPGVQELDGPIDA